MKRFTLRYLVTGTTVALLANAACAEGLRPGGAQTMLGAVQAARVQLLDDGAMSKIRGQGLGTGAAKAIAAVRNSITVAPAVFAGVGPVRTTTSRGGVSAGFSPGPVGVSVGKTTSGGTRVCATVGTVVGVGAAVSGSLGVCADVKARNLVLTASAGKGVGLGADAGSAFLTAGVTASLNVSRLASSFRRR